MGTRANVKVLDGNSVVFLYQHYDGYDLPETVRTVLERKQRWDDGPYLARMIFCAMVRGNEDGETGYGISSELGDGDDRVTVVDCNKQKVTLPSGTSYSFNKFIKVDLKEKS